MFRYIDDITLLSKTRHELEAGIEKLRELLGHHGFSINEGKTQKMNLLVDWRTYLNWFECLGYKIQASKHTNEEGDKTYIEVNIQVGDKGKSEFGDRMVEAINENREKGVQAVLRTVWWPGGVVDSYISSFPQVTIGTGDGWDVIENVIKVWEAAQRVTEWLPNVRNEARRQRYLHHHFMVAWEKRIRNHEAKIKKVEKWNRQHPSIPRKVQPSLEPLEEFKRYRFPRQAAFIKSDTLELIMGARRWSPNPHRWPGYWQRNSHEIDDPIEDKGGLEYQIILAYIRRAKARSQGKEERRRKIRYSSKVLKGYFWIQRDLNRRRELLRKLPRVKLTNQSGQNPRDEIRS
jgi:hypothetical protein